MDYLLFIFTFACVSLLPGLCMNLAFSLGLSLGYKITLWMMFGELFGLGLIVVCCAFGAGFITQHEFLFKVFKICAALYLLYIAFNLFFAKSKISEEKISKKEKLSLLLQGFITSVSNPKAWVFILSIVPSFLNFNTNLFLLVFIILFIEFCSLSLYALGGSLFKTFMNQHVTKLNKISALCVAVLGISMFFT
ncbi:TPA: LysE family translocator [Campylobacter jejuni]|nr:LysE family translocator [Campylobacter jejuni]HDZ5083834.1 LysE family translocator [Campylobacter jejuni]HDZ5084811.1 LysE family translocator [Campylobacter jejuni]HDZ5086520.1 LysE family translocator [Campylobacter jejuni]HDZ5089580.1 LysE family translocator [Campylobacter jejuni]